jgi:hypothetical protein
MIPRALRLFAAAAPWAVSGAAYFGILAVIGRGLGWL